MNTKVAKKQNNKGFTLIELIVVIAIIAVLAAILAPQYLRYVEKSRVSADQSTANEILNAVKTASADEAVYDKIAATTGSTKTNVVTWNSNGIKAVGTASPATDIYAEVSKDFTSSDRDKAPKSHTYSGQTFTVSVSIDANQTVAVEGDWDNTPAGGQKPAGK